MLEHQDPEALRRAHVAGPFDLTGAIDLHLHSAPCMFPRLGDDVQMAQNARASGMRAIALKSHHENTVSRAYHTMMTVPGVLVVGGVTLNQCVGGVNPAAVEAALKLGGKLVWGPTGHACYHGLVTGEMGSWGVAGMELPGAPPGGITVLKDGRLIPEMIEILDLIKKHDGLFCTSHLSPDEILKVVEYCAARDIRVLVNHIYYFPRVQIDFAIDIARKGAFIEFCSALVIPSRHRKELRYDYELLAETVQKVGVSRCIMSTDAGGLISSLFPHEQFRMFGQRMLGYGVSPEEVRTMMCDNPARLLNLPLEWKPGSAA
jgi:hypothetical protein